MKMTRKSLIKLLPLTFAAVVMSAPAAAGDAAAGKEIYDGRGACASCHGATGAGDGVVAAALNPKPTNFVIPAFRLDTDGDSTLGSDADLSNAIKNGTAQYGGNPAMPGRAFSDAEISDLVAYIHTLKQ